MPNILIIDPDPAVGGLFERALQTAGHSVALAIDAAAGMQVLRDSAIDVAIIDVNMPENEGLEMLAVVRRDFPAMNVIIVSNGYVPLPAGPLFGTVEVLSKPVRVDDLRELVHRVLEYR
jgi:DNA-binding NtrC family response regulator